MNRPRRLGVFFSGRYDAEAARLNCRLYIQPLVDRFAIVPLQISAVMLAVGTVTIVVHLLGAPSVMTYLAVVFWTGNAALDYRRTRRLVPLQRRWLDDGPCLPTLEESIVVTSVLRFRLGLVAVAALLGPLAAFAGDWTFAVGYLLIGLSAYPRTVFVMDLPRPAWRRAADRLRRSGFRPAPAPG